MHALEAVKAIKALEGKDLRPLADKFHVTVWKEGKINKGWAGHVIERYLGLPLSSRQAPNGGSWELKVVPFKRKKSGGITMKETMAITKINATDVADTPFEQSHLLAKLRSMVVCARMFESKAEEASVLMSVATFDLIDPALRAQVRSDYEEVRRVIRELGFEALTGKMGVLVQPRTKGKGHGSTTRAFYARTRFVKTILGLSDVSPG